jgi:hypothetical protein
VARTFPAGVQLRGRLFVGGEEAAANALADYGGPGHIALVVDCTTKRKFGGRVPRQWLAKTAIGTAVPKWKAAYVNDWLKEGGFRPEEVVDRRVGGLFFACSQVAVPSPFVGPP